MREPHLRDLEAGDTWTPFSALTTRELRAIAAGDLEPHPRCEDPDNDVDVARRYAAVLLRERSG